MTSKEESKAQKARFRGKEFMLKGRMIFPNLLKPKADGNGRLKYSMQFFWKDNCKRNAPIVEQMEKLISTHKQEWYPNHPNFINPIKHYDTYVKQDGSANPTYLKGHHWIHASSNKDFPPAVFDHNKKRIVDGAELTDGRECLVTVQMYPYNFQGKVGVAISPRAVILLPGGEVPYGNEPVDPDVLFSEDVEKEINKTVEQAAGEANRNDIAMDIPF